jgi:peroxiredoxin
MKNQFIITTIYFLIIVSISGANPGSDKNKVANKAEEVSPLLIGEQVPDLTLKDSEGKNFELLKAVKEKPTVLIFFRGGWCPYCNLHLKELQNIEKDLLDLGYQILAISMDKWELLNSSSNKNNLTYKLLSDNSAKAVKAFGIAFKMEDKLVEKYKTHNIDLESASREKHHILPVPSAFIIGTDGMIKFEYVNPNYKVRIKADLLLAAARSALN